MDITHVCLKEKMEENHILKKPAPKTARGKRILERRKPQLIEGVKMILFVNTTTASSFIKQVMADMYSLKKPNAIYLNHKKELHPFDQEEHLLYLSTKSDCGLFMTCYDTKKRPQTLLLGRTFDSQLLDMFELHVLHYSPILKYHSAQLPSIDERPLLLFQGEAFTQDPQYIKLKNLFLDFFHSGESIDKVYFHNTEHQGPEYVISFTVLPNNNILLHTDRIILSKESDTSIPKISLVPLGPHIEFRMGRTKSSNESLQKQAYKQPRVNKPKKIKNVSHDPMGDKYGRIHNPKQDFSKLTTRRVKALKSK